MKILVIGCNGFIGSNIYRYLTAKNYNVFGADIHILNPNTFLLKQDLSNILQLFNEQHYNICINASGSSTVRFSITNEQEDYQLNYLNVKKIIEVILQLQPTCKFINLSSAAVYGNPKSLPIKESDDTLPISPYGKHKLLSEELLFNENLKNHLSTISLRIFSVYGNTLKKQLFWDIYQKSKHSNEIELYGIGNETRDFIHIDDLMLAIEIIILNAKFDGTTINVASGNDVTINDAANTLINYIKPNCKIIFTGQTFDADPKFWKADISKLNKLGFSAKVTLTSGLKNYAQWLQELN